MRLCWTIAVCVLCGMLLGCEQSVSESSSDKNIDTELVKTLNNVGVENAIITQHTIYPYHFVTDSEQLNDLGRRDLAVLARHFAENAGTLNVRRGKTPAALYEARVAQVTESLKQAGVDMARLSVSDEMPGGTGMSSERVVTILKQAPQSLSTTGSSYQTMTGAVRR
jgi:hypothetical protein